MGEEEEEGCRLRFARLALARLALVTALALFSLPSVRTLAPVWPPCPLVVGPSAQVQTSEHTLHRVFDFNVTHDVLSVEPNLVTGITYQVSMEISNEVSEWSLHIQGCQPHCASDPLQWTPKHSGNHTIRALYKLYGQDEVYEVSKIYTVFQDCEVALGIGEGNLSWKDLGSRRCLVRLPGGGLLVTLTSLNIPCNRGVLSLGPEGPSLCGKLEELPQRVLHVPRATWLSTAGPFSLSFRQVHDCYNVTLVGSNGSAEVPPVMGLDCTFSLLLPWGYLVSLELITTASSQNDQLYNKHSCQGIQVEVWEGNVWWGHCSEGNSEPAHLRLTSRTNKLILRVTSPQTVTPDLQLPSLTLRYSARGDKVIVGSCSYPAVLSGSGRTCLSLEETPTSWDDAEQTCRTRGGHLASIRSQQDQTTIDNLLINSASYHESNAYWVGATDRLLEGDFRWSDTMPFTYTNWFPGWEGSTSRQPNDDGLSGQDCVELRRLYRIPPSLSTLTQTFTWNDRDCSTSNYFLCETLPSGEDMDLWRRDMSIPECNRTIHLNWDSPRTIITSPGFPHPYPDNTACLIQVTALPLTSITVEFEEFVLESEPKCGYDYLEILVENEAPRRLCGDQSERLKLLRLSTRKPQLSLLFVSDYSNHFTGFKAKLSIEQGGGGGCGGDERLVRYEGHCYLFVSYPEVTWQTAQDICQGIKGKLAVVESSSLDRFLTTKLRESSDYSTSELYWLGAKLDPVLGWSWQPEKTPISYSGWPEGYKNLGGGDEKCLSIQWVSRPGSSGLYWQSQPCDMVGGYLCQIKDQDNTGIDLNVNRTENASSGWISSPLFPLGYPPNMDYEVRIQGPERTRIVYKLTDLDLEPQANCLYDFLQIDGGERLCGHKDQRQLNNLRISSLNNIGIVRFRSDYSVSGRGWRLDWKAVEASWCPSKTLPASTGRISTPNYPDYLLPDMDCTATILAPVGKRVVLEMEDWDVSGEADIELWLGGGRSDRLRPYKQRQLLSEGIYVSREERLLVRLNTGNLPAGRGFSAMFKTVGLDWIEERRVELGNSSSEGKLRHVNYPLEPPRNLKFIQRLTAPLGHTIHIDISPPYNTKLVVNEDCNDGAELEVKDSYAEPNGTVWWLCAVPLESSRTIPLLAGPAALMEAPKISLAKLDDTPTLMAGPSDVVTAHLTPEPLSIDSYLNSLTLTHVYTGRRRSPFPLNASLHLTKDALYKMKLKSSNQVETCVPNPCLNGGKCTNSSGKSTCQCTGHFTGLLCGLTLCELEPCVFGRCELVGTSNYRCHCKEGYLGERCEKRQRPCASNPCDSRGECHETNDATFTCRCHAWWEGTRCERRMLHIPYKPLSERMLQEPFWLGLITVTIVLGVLGLFWCAKRHFPEKLEKLLAEDDPNRPYVSSGRCSSTKDRHQLTPSASVTSSSSAVAVAVSASTPQQGKPRLLTRLRKPSLLLTPSGRQRQKTSRTFSLDDLLKPPPTNIPSPRKKRNNSTPIKKTSDKKEILQQLVRSRQASAESIAMSAKLSVDGAVTPLPHQPSSGTDSAETSFTANKITNGGRGLDAKLEKKVTFARLLDRVSSEISSGSEVEMSREVQGSGSSSNGKRDSISPTIGSNCGLGVDSRSSSEVQLTTPGEVVSRKANSADSLLAMLRGLGSAASSSSSSTPTTTPREDAPDTPMSSSSGISDSPPVYIRKNTIQVAVVDPLNVVSRGGSNSTGSEHLLVPPTILLEVPNKCLSPIREVPTPIPSPALTPTMPRHNPMSLLAPLPYKPSIPKVAISNSKEDMMEMRPTNLVIPVVRVEEVQSPTKTFRMDEKLGRWVERAPLLKEVEKRGSVDLAVPPPVITVTCSDSEADSPPVPVHGLMPPPTNTAFLSPFSICSRQDRTTSESNLSSSGYSSMASPAPSRCGSNNPLCLTDVEEGSGKRRSGKVQEIPTQRRRSDSETYSENEIQSQSNDEGFTTDPKDEDARDKEKEALGEEFKEKIRGLIELAPPPGGVKHCRSFDTGLERKSRKKMRVKQCSSVEAGLDGYRKDESQKTCKVLLELPSIVVDGEDTVFNCSPVSSRSESPLSDKTGVGRFSPMFYGRLTDSDGLYDCASSDTTKTSRKYGRRKERKRSKSPTKQQTLLDVPGKPEKGSRSSTKPSPKRRTRPKPMSSTSSSSGESINSIRDLSICLSPDKLAEKYNRSNATWMESKAKDSSQIEEVKTKMLPNNIKPKKISRLKSVGNQIRFLRRLELSLKRSREGSGSPEKPLLGKPDNSERREKRLSWLRQRGAASDTLIISQGEDVPLFPSGHTD